MANVYKTGFGPWKKTVVEHAGQRTIHSGGASVETKNGTVCVTDKGLFADNSTCYLNEEPDKGSGGYADGKLVGSSKEIALKMSGGQVKNYRSGVFGVNSLEKSGDTISVVKRGIFGNSVVDHVSASEVQSIKSEDCKVCKGVNPLYEE